MKWFHVGLAAASLLLTLSTTAKAQQVPEYSVSRLQNKATLTMRSGDFRFEEVLSPTAFAFTIAYGGDRVQIAGDDRGALSVARGDRTHTLNMTVVDAGQLRELRVSLGRSPALRELERVAQAERAAESKYATFLLNAHALLSTVQGEMRATGDFIARAMGQRAGGFKTVAERGSVRADDCWDGYVRSVLRYTYELEVCIGEARSRFNPILTAWCGYEYNLKATLAGYRLLDCAGFP